METRKPYLDTLKLAGFLCVFTGHFIGLNRMDFFEVLRTPPWFYVVGGMSGKFGVALLAVISSYVTYESASRTDRETSVSSGVYIVRRYLYFALCALIANAGMTILHVCGLQIEGGGYSLLPFLKNTLLLGPELFTPFWCMPAFLLISVLSYFNGRTGVSAAGVLVEIGTVFVIGGFMMLWVAIGLMGSFLAALNRTELMKRMMTRVPVLPTVVLLVVSHIIIKRPESHATYVIDGVAAALIILALEYSTYLKRLASHRVLSFFGRYSMELYILHLVAIYPVMYFVPAPLKVKYVLALAALCVLAVAVSKVIKAVMARMPFA